MTGILVLETVAIVGGTVLLSIAFSWQIGVAAALFAYYLKGVHS